MPFDLLEPIPGAPLIRTHDVSIAASATQALTAWRRASGRLGIRVVAVGYAGRERLVGATAVAQVREMSRFAQRADVYLAATVLFSLLAFGTMCLDKYKAKTGGRRVPEAVLHTFELLGGWPGSLLGQRTFRHKNRKITYQAVFWAIVAVHLVLLAWTLYLWWNPPSGPLSPEPVPTESAEPAAD